MKKTIALLIALSMVLLLLAGCSSNNNSANETATAARTKITVGGLNGPTGMGLSKLMDDQANGLTANDYTFSMSSAPDDIVGKVTSGELDIAAIPSNLAATLYQKTGGKVQLLALNTLGVLHVLENGDTIHSISDLKGKTIYATGQGTVVEYALNHILSENGIDPEKDITIVYKSEHAELSTLVTTGDADIAVLPEPFVTTTLQKSENTRLALDLTKEWDKVESSSKLAMGVMIVSTEFAENNPEALKTFLKEYKASTEYVNANPAEAGKLIEEYGIIPSAAVAEASIPNCNIVFVSGQEMKDQIQPLYDILFKANPKSIGGAIPDDAFYYISE